jgi:large subunit ribosomal protein L22
MLITAEQRNSRQSDIKVRLVANSVKKLSIELALKQLAVMEQKGSLVVMKVLRQAIANAIHNHNLALSDLVIQSILVNSGTSYKRFRAVSRGRAHSILKKTCHVRVTLATKAAAPVVPTPAVAPVTAPEIKTTQKASAVAKKAPAKKAVKKETN